MEKKITGYTTVDISQWHRKEHFEAFQSVAQCTYNQTVQLDITAFLKTVKKNNNKFQPAYNHIKARWINAHLDFRMA
ncbi:type A chloramphenicol O-acetyltransferase, partial [Colwellia sp. C2M11]|uniref:CatA-like O-acetyltransferase n=1 Tax=Colwellia sp. C2M11 TaxID=2841566 RepID=UPI002090F04C